MLYQIISQAHLLSNTKQYLHCFTKSQWLLQNSLAQLHQVSSCLVNNKLILFHSFSYNSIAIAIQHLSSHHMIASSALMIQSFKRSVHNLSTLSSLWTVSICAQINGVPGLIKYRFQYSSDFNFRFQFLR